MIIKENIKIESLSGSKERRLYIYLPKEFDHHNRYPVMYMFDGHNVFYDEDATYGKSWGIGNYLDDTETQLIVVAVECNHEGTSRLDEYSPFPVNDKIQSMKGLGPKYMDWLVHTLKPAIDSRFPTLRDRRHTYIAGSSMGGLMSLYALTAYNHIFSRAAALSPSIWIGPNKVLNMIKNATIEKDTWLYMDYGSEEISEAHKGKMLQHFNRVYNSFLAQGVYACGRIIPGGTHTESSWQQQIPIFMQCLGLIDDTL